MMIAKKWGILAMGAVVALLGPGGRQAAGARIDEAFDSTVLDTTIWTDLTAGAGRKVRKSIWSTSRRDPTLGSGLVGKTFGLRDAMA